MKYLLFILCFFNFIFCEIEATTNNGIKVILNDDGTWQYVKKFKYIERDVEPAPKEEYAVGNIIEYPESAIERGTEGIVVVAALIDKKGMVEICYLIKGVSKDLDLEAVRAVKKSRWYPAQRKNKPIDVWVNIPVSFRLQ